MAGSDPKETADLPPAGWRREYGYPRGAPLMGAVLGALALAAMLAALVSVFLDSPLSSDSSYLAYWPLWFRLLFYVCTVGLAGLCVGLPVLMVVQSLLRLYHRHDRVLLDDRGATVFQGEAETFLSWEDLSVSRHLLHFRLRAGERECRLVLGLERQWEMMAELEGRQAGGPGRRLRAGEAVPLVDAQGRRAVGALFGTMGLLLLSLVLLPHGLLHLPGTIDPLFQPPDLGARIMGLVASICCLAFAVSMLLPVGIATLQLLSDELQHRTWSGRVRRVPYDSVISLQWWPPTRWNVTTRLRLHYREVGADRERALTFDSQSCRLVLLNALREELIRRGELASRGEAVWEQKKD